ncbi:hypothetical protein OSB04_019307 [Centaurea solstitialis]|uniref:Uncharacterized protein n=1 Tax=Centaurea solstitialis TaxID=347529 RepID=A0AA38SQ29_9ASTR|nr:hypothetical protein OSB04_019307 [Centaurea solstitialis]
MYSPEQIARHLVDKRALTLLIMALPNDMYTRVDILTNARDVWLEIEQQMQGGHTTLKSQKESALNAYEGFRARENESLTDSYQRLNSFWKRRMIHFLDLLNENLMKSIREGPIRPTVTVAAVPRMDKCPALPSYVVE